MEKNNIGNYGAWYECEEVTAEYVREHMFKKLKQTHDGGKFDDDILRSILLKHIPDTMKNFGSLRGWKVTETLGEPYLEKITLNDDRFYLENSFGRLTFNRYYKGDYEGIVVTNALVGALNSHTVLLDCRTIKDVVDDILKDFE